MRPDDYDEFAALLDATFDMIGKSPASKQISPAAKAMFFSDMRRYGLPLVKSALAAHRADPERGKFTPSPADLIAQIERHQHRDNRPGPEQAFALALASMDEQATVVWTEECAQALEAARPVLDAAGAISGRKTFIEVYEQIVERNRAAGVHPTWFASPGLDKIGYAAAVKTAVAAGLLPAPALATLLPAPIPASEAAPKLDPREQLDFIKRELGMGDTAKQAKLDAASAARAQTERDTSAAIWIKVEQEQAEQTRREAIARAEQTRPKP